MDRTCARILGNILHFPGPLGDSAAAAVSELASASRAVALPASNTPSSSAKRQASRIILDFRAILA